MRRRRGGASRRTSRSRCRRSPHAWTCRASGTGSSCPSWTSPPTATSGWRGPARPAPRSCGCAAPTASRSRSRPTTRRSTSAPRVVMVNRVLYRSSAIVDAKARLRDGARARARCRSWTTTTGSASCRWTCTTSGCDLYTAGTLKWLCGGPGMVVPLRAPRPAADARARRHRVVRHRGAVLVRQPSTSSTTPTARRLEHGTPPAPVFFLAQGGLDIIARGRAWSGSATRQGELTDHVIARADAAGTPGAHASRPRRDAAAW